MTPDRSPGAVPGAACYLLSNDDGYLAPGLSAMAAVLRTMGHTLVVAPDRNRSGASNSLTLSRPLRLQQAPSGFWVVDGTPTDCVHLALTAESIRVVPDVVLGGINAGENLGDDVLYSGTVAVAMEGRLMGYPSLAVSLAGESPTHYATAAEVVRSILQQMRERPLPADTLFNINVPDVPLDQLRGVAVTRLGLRHPSTPAVHDLDPRQRPLYWVGAAGAPQDAVEGTDFHAVRNGWVSVTPLKVDLTRHEAVATVRDWMHPIRLQSS